jgi:hypothetical protein
MIMNRPNGEYLAILACLVVLVSMAAPAAALGVKPSQTSMDFQPGLSSEHSFTIVNSESRTLDVSLGAEGELSQYITLGQTSASLQPGEEKAVTFTVSLPSDLEPGTREGYIRVTEQADGDCPSCTSAVVSLLHRVRVNVPYPGKYLEGGVEINQNPDRIYFSVRVKNMGQEDIEEASAEFVLSDYSGEVLRTGTGPASMPSLDEKELVASFDPSDIEPGFYSLDTLVIYDSSALGMEDHFKFGTPSIELVEHEATMPLGGIRPISIRLKNMWNEPLSGSASISLSNMTGAERPARTVPFELGPREEKLVQAYIETGGLAASAYTASLTLSFDSRIQEESFVVTLSEQPLQPPIQDETIFAIIIVLILVAAILVFLVLRK